MNYTLDMIDFKSEYVLNTILLTIIDSIALALLPYLQYKYRMISKFTGDNMSIAADLLAFGLIHIGTFRNYAFIEANLNSKGFDVGLFNNLIYFIGMFLLCLGAILVLLAFRKLGLRGMYFGDHFGFIMKKRIDSFPYNYTENPQYNGSIMMYFGFSLIRRSITGLFLTLFIVLNYKFLFIFFEKKRLKEIYKENKK